MTQLPLTDLNLQPVYNHGNCPELLPGLYEPLLAQAVRYDRTTYTFTAEGLIAAAAGAANFVPQRWTHPPHLRPQRPPGRAASHP